MLSFKVDGLEGHETITLPFHEAVVRIEKEMTEGEKWLYVEGKHIETTDNLPAVLLTAKDVNLMCRLVSDADIDEDDDYRDYDDYEDE
jgi:hypothetical protein